MKSLWLVVCVEIYKEMIFVREVDDGVLYDPRNDQCTQSNPHYIFQT